MRLPSNREHAERQANQSFKTLRWGHSLGITGHVTIQRGVGQQTLFKGQIVGHPQAHEVRFLHDERLLRAAREHLLDGKQLRAGEVASESLQNPAGDESFDRDQVNPSIIFRLDQALKQATIAKPNPLANPRARLSCRSDLTARLRPHGPSAPKAKNRPTAQLYHEPHCSVPPKQSRPPYAFLAPPAPRDNRSPRGKEEERGVRRTLIRLRAAFEPPEKAATDEYQGRRRAPVGTLATDVAGLIARYMFD